MATGTNFYIAFRPVVSRERAFAKRAASAIHAVVSLEKFNDWMAEDLSSPSLRLERGRIATAPPGDMDKRLVQ